MELSTAVNNSVCEQYHSDGVVCLSSLKQGLFITAEINNKDYNPSSVTATDSCMELEFHSSKILVLTMKDNMDATLQVDY